MNSIVLVRNAKSIPKIIIEFEFEYRSNVEIAADTLTDAYKFVCGLHTLIKYGGDNFVNIDNVKDEFVAKHIDSYYMYDDMPLYDCTSYAIYVLSEIHMEYDKTAFVDIIDNDEIAKALLDGGKR